MALIDATGAHKSQITWAARYGAWVDVEVEYNPHGIAQSIRFQGQHFDEESGLHYSRFRYYDTALGSYITQDPIGLRGVVNIYGYSNFDPIQRVDVKGLSAIAGALPVAGGLAVADGPLPFGDVLAIGALAIGGIYTLATNLTKSEVVQKIDRTQSV